MSDELLRRLTREAATPADRLQLARELERAGRRWEALDALLPAREDAEVRREIGRLSWWSTSRTQDPRVYIESPAVQRAPRVRWTAPVGDRSIGEVLASPLGVVASAWDTGVLDPEDGHVRFRVDAFHANLIADDVLLARPRDADWAARDLWTGELLWRAPGEPVHVLHDSFADGTVLVQERRGSGVTQVAYLVVDPRRPLERTWRFHAADDLSRLHTRGVVAPGRVHVRRGNELQSLDTREGRPLRRLRRDVEPLLADACAVLVRLMKRRRGRTIEALSLRSNDGTRLWTLDGFEDAALMTPSWVVATPQERFSWPRHRTPSVVDRRTGRVTAVLRADGDLVFLAAAGELIYASDTWYVSPVQPTFFADQQKAPPCDHGNARLYAFTFHGELAWSVPQSAIAPSKIVCLAAAPRRLYGGCEDGRVFCLEEAV